MRDLVWLFFALAFIAGVFVGYKTGRYLRKRKIRRVASDAYHQGTRSYANKDLKIPNPYSIAAFQNWWEQQKY